MMHDNLDQLRKMHSFPARIQIRILERARPFVYSLGQDSGWLYFKVRLGKTITKGYPNNVKGWKRRFFFALRDDWEFFLVLDSKTFKKCFGASSEIMASSGGEDAERKSIDGAAASGDEGMSKRISLKKLAQKVEEAMGMSLATKSTLVAKGMVIGEKRLREEASNVSLNEAKSKEKEALPPLATKKAKLATSRLKCAVGNQRSQTRLTPREGTSANPRIA
ncbi:hypothetical protein Acr_10g0008630 [Actinidia rufa]|uniref:Uncharacterized protein n=1 Tax=Actinidia rufa TaxID=165716 RepID=A0A7J0F9W2_9ERIC|nr:hypothetical protein Acr_10g0008630 [Actinidia rufa]